MKFFIDTANLDEIKEAQSLGILDGVTTNPSLMAKEGITGDKNIINHCPLSEWRPGVIIIERSEITNNDHSKILRNEEELHKLNEVDELVEIFE